MSIPSINESLSPLRAVSYLRVSTHRQARVGGEPEGLSIPAQREACRRRAIELVALLVSEFVERGRSGRSLERPELKRMLDYVQTRPVDFVIVHKIDRLARNRAGNVAVTNQIVAAGAHLASTSEAINATPSGQLLHHGLDRGVLFTQPRGRGDEGNATGSHPRRDLADLEQQTREALDLLQDAHETYQQATNPVRKQLIRAIFTRILLGHEADQIRAELNDPYSALNETGNSEDA